MKKPSNSLRVLMSGFSLAPIFSLQRLPSLRAVSLRAVSLCAVSLRAVSMCRSLMIASWLGCLSLAFSTSVGLGQDPFGDSPMSDNPFGATEPSATAQPDSPFGGFAPAANAAPTSATTAPSSGGTLERDPNPVVRLLRETPPQTPTEMAQGLTWVVRFKRWDEVRRLLDTVAAKNWSLDQLSELAKSGEPALWIRLTNDEAGLTVEQRQLLNDVLAAPGKLARDPAWLDSWIEKLAHPQPGERRLAQLRLQDGGHVAILRLLERLLDGDAKVDPGMLAGTVAEFGASGVDALKAACLVKDPERAARVFIGIAEIPGNEFSAELGAGLSSSLLSPQARTELSDIILRRFNKLPTPEAIRAFLAERFRIKLGDYQQTRTSDIPTGDIVWRQTADGRLVQPVESSDQDRQLEAVAQLAAHRLNLTIATTDELVDCGAVVLQRAYQVQPGTGLSEDRSGLLANFNQTLATEESYWIRVFDRASELQMHGGAVRAIEMLIASARGHYLVPIDFMSKLLGDSRPVVRYVALMQIVKLDPQHNFAGAEKALDVALEMTRLGSGPQALVVGMNSELRLAAEQQLQMQAGARVITAHSARSALQALDASTPIDMVIVVDRMADQSIYELLQRVRASERGRSLPIAVLTDELYQHERRMIGEMPGVVHGVLTRTPEQMQRVVGLLMRRLDTQSFTTEERNDFARLAGQFLSRIGSNRDQYSFYPLSDLRAELLAVGTGLPTDSRLELLSGLGSRESQQQLLGLTSRASLSATEREQAAVAFGQSVARFGMNLGREDVLQAYDVYNALGPNDPATAAALGVVLDTIEQRARN